LGIKLVFDLFNELPDDLHQPPSAVRYIRICQQPFNIFCCQQSVNPFFFRSPSSAAAWSAVRPPHYSGEASLIAAAVCRLLLDAPVSLLLEAPE